MQHDRHFVQGLINDDSECWKELERYKLGLFQKISHYQRKFGVSLIDLSQYEEVYLAYCGMLKAHEHSKLIPLMEFLETNYIETEQYLKNWFVDIVGARFVKDHIILRGIKANDESICHLFVFGDKEFAIKSAATKILNMMGFNDPDKKDCTKPKCLDYYVLTLRVLDYLREEDRQKIVRIDKYDPSRASLLTYLSTSVIYPVAKILYSEIHNKPFDDRVIKDAMGHITVNIDDNPTRVNNIPTIVINDEEYSQFLDDVFAIMENSGKEKSGAKYVKILKDKYLKGKKNEQIAAEYNMERGNVRQTLFRARNMFASIGKKIYYKY